LFQSIKIKYLPLFYFFTAEFLCIFCG